MKRLLLEQLEHWRISPTRKPLLLMGARQVGKTYSLKAFGADRYENTVYLNFESVPALAKLFEQSLKPKAIIAALAIEMGIDIHPGKTLIIFDEVQECPAALNSLKYFNEDEPSYHLCAAGSLLGVKLAHEKGFPVGKVDFLHLYPLSFFEFLEAISQDKLKNYLQAIVNLVPLPNNIHESLLNYFKLYLLVGGMPEAVLHFVENSDLKQIRLIQANILRSYELDFAKHAPSNEVMRINQIWQSLPSQLAKENKKFVYSIIRKGARAKDFEIALQWLNAAGLIFKISNIAIPKFPLKAYASTDFFKIYASDVGLLGALANIPIKTLLYGNELFTEFKGSLTENYVAQELARAQYGLCYWTSENTAEVDFIIQESEKIYPLEIKSGSSNKKKSIKIYADKYKPNLILRCSPMNLKKEGVILNCPLYLLNEIDRLIAIASQK